MIKKADYEKNKDQCATPKKTISTDDLLWMESLFNSLIVD